MNHPLTENRDTRHRSSLRWPIQLQLLVPMVSVVLLASLLATAVTAYSIAQRVRIEQEESLRRVVKTLAEATFPLTERVLSQMSGLSGAEFVLVSPEGSLRENTLPIETEWLAELTQVAGGASSDPTSKRIVSLGGREYLVDFVTVAGRPYSSDEAILFILYPEDQLTSRVHQAVYPALIAGVVAATIALGVSTWLARRLARPIHMLVAQTATIAQGEFTPMPMPRRNDELRDLAESINRMTSQLADYEQEVRRNERFKALGQLGAAMAHQLRNAATGGRMAIELHRRDCALGASDESLDVALRQLQLMESYLRQFLSIRGRASAIRERLEVASLVEEVLSLLRPLHVHAGVDLQFLAPSQPLILQGDPEEVRQLVTNLVLNALEAARTGSRSPCLVRVELARVSERLGALRVHDSGPGPDPAMSDRLFESFVTTKPDGVGLGLFVARQIAEGHGGCLRWQRGDEMTCFVFEFPLFLTQDHGAHTDRG